MLHHPGDQAKQADQGARTTRREELLALAKRLGNVSEACRQLKVDRSAYYRALRASGAGSTAPSSRMIPPVVEQKLIALCLEFPEWGCDRLAYYLTLTGTPLSSPTAQKILIRHGFGRVAQRLEAARRQQSGCPEGDLSA